MKIIQHHFSNMAVNLLDQALMDVKTLDKRLMPLLIKELELGNKITSVSLGWPTKNSSMVQMKYKLQVDHSVENGVRYVHRNDPHYWIHEYTTFSGNESDSGSDDAIISGDREADSNG